jgi:hypothetical protein
MKFTGSDTINGTLYYPHGGSGPSNVKVIGSATFTGGQHETASAITDLDPIPAVPADAVYVDPINVSGNGYIQFRMTGSGVLIGPPIPSGTYVINKDATGSSFKSNGSYDFTLATGGKVTLYLAGNFQTNGNGSINPNGKPTDLVMYGMDGTTSFNMNGTGSVSAAAYMPNAAINMNGNPGYYGSFVGKSVKLNGGVHFHYDEDLGSVGGGASGYQISMWNSLR